MAEGMARKGEGGKGKQRKSAHPRTTVTRTCSWPQSCQRSPALAAPRTHSGPCKRQHPLVFMGIGKLQMGQKRRKEGRRLARNAASCPLAPGEPEDRDPPWRRQGDRLGLINGTAIINAGCHDGLSRLFRTLGRGLGAPAEQMCCPLRQGGQSWSARGYLLQFQRGTTSGPSASAHSSSQEPRRHFRMDGSVTYLISSGQGEMREGAHLPRSQGKPLPTGARSGRSASSSPRILPVEQPSRPGSLRSSVSVAPRLRFLACSTRGV